LQSYKNSNHATHLRGLAALSVMAIHYNGFGLRDIFPSDTYLNYLSNNFINLGTRGPLVFYIASGYVLNNSFKRIKNFRTFILIRYMRLMPLYFCVSAFAYLTNSVETFIPISTLGSESDNFDILILLKKLLFLDIFFRDAYTFSPVSIAPFIVIEFWLSLLLLVTYIKNFKPITCLVLSFILYYAARHIPLMIGDSSFHYEIFRSQFWFLLGIIISQIKSRVWLKFGYYYITFLIIVSISVPFISAYCIAIASVIYLLNENNNSGKLYFLIFFGNICFSIYLLHLPVYYFILHTSYFKLNYFCTAGLVILTSIFTFYFIEQPFIKISKKFR
jgi:peptidoglycan/LPS O-acetylase OafA/YrhL